jgi:hypothetical protein
MLYDGIQTYSKNKTQCQAHPIKQVKAKQPVNRTRENVVALMR